MVYIVSDERIAVENFEQGKIYKVDFVDETVLYGVCVGIGSDFVMLSGDISGYIFPLTMQTASQVTSIDLYDPTPPEPPVPWTNLLQYQTGVPPFEFPTTDTSLFSWYIAGEGVGDKTANLWDETNAVSGYIKTDGTIGASAASITTGYLPVLSNTDYTITLTANVANVNLLIGYYDSTQTFISRWSSLALEVGSNTITRTTPNNTAYMRITRHTQFTNCMLNEGSTALPYEPYGYKIPILCNENLTNIYLDAPLSEGEILYSTDIDTAIVTDIGENELTVGTTQQPTDMQIVYKIADR